MRKKIIVALFSIVSVSSLLAQDSLKTEILKEAVVTGTKFDLAPERSGKVIFKIKSDQLKTGRNLWDVLNEVPGVQMDGNFGTPGTNISYYVRGGRSRNSLILLDGVPMNDPSGIDPLFDLRFLSTDQLDQVEILQGGLSTLHGSGASASVIHIQTKKAVEDGVHGSLALDGASWKAFGQNLNVNGKLDKFTFQLLTSNFKSDGFSAALDTLDAGFDDDGFERRNGLLKIGYQIAPKIKVGLFGGVDWFDADYDAAAFTDGNDNQKQKQKRIGTNVMWDYSKGYFALTAQYAALNRDINGSYPTEYNGSSLYGEIINKHEVNPMVTILSGVSFQNLAYEEKDAVSNDTTSFAIVDPYASILFAMPEGLSIHAGLRLNNHSEYGSNLVYNFNPSWLLKVSDKIKIKPFASVSTAFITPTLYQLHTPWGGNSNLDPEESINLEAGASFFLSDQVSFTVVSFKRKESDVIIYTFRYENFSGEREIDGVTVDAQLDLNNILTIKGDFAWVTSDAKQSFYRIPSRKVGASVQVKPLKNTNVTLRYLYTGTRVDQYYDEFFTPQDIKLADYNLLDLSVSQGLLKNHLFLHGSIYNVTDEKFVGIYGYTTRGRNYSVGVSYSF